MGITKRDAEKRIREHFEKSHPKRTEPIKVHINLAEYSVLKCVSENPLFWEMVRPREPPSELRKPWESFWSKENEPDIKIYIHLGEYAFIHTYDCSHYKERNSFKNWRGPYASYSEAYLKALSYRDAHPRNCSHCEPHKTHVNIDDFTVEQQKPLIIHLAKRIRKKFGLNPGYI